MIKPPPSLWSLLLLILPILTSAQDAEVFPPNPVKRSISSTKIEQHLKVDGRLDEPVWSNAKPASDLIQIEPFQGQNANQQTDIRVLFNKQFLYFGVFSKDSLGQKALRAIDFKRDFDFRKHDLINLSFDGFKDERNAMVFATNAFGVQRDLLSFDDVFYDLDWDGLWRVRTSAQ